MVLLPRGNPLKENVNPGKINLPAALGKLQVGNFSGYLRFDFPDKTGVLVFEKGRLVSALFEAGLERFIAYDALAAIFEHSLFSHGVLNVYRLSPELAISVHTLLHGEILYKGQELKLIDIKALLGRLKESAITGCLRIYTDERVALIFYREGSPLGFFHDGSTEIEKTADTSMSVARLPGAKVDVLTTRGGAAGVMADLMASADIAALWDKKKKDLVRQNETRQEDVLRDRVREEKERRINLLAVFEEAASRHIGKIGSSMVKKEFDKVLADSLDDGALALFYERLSRDARLVAGPSKIEAMIKEMQRNASSLLLRHKG